MLQNNLGPEVAERPDDPAVLGAPSHVHLAYRPGVPLARAFTG